MGALLWTLIGVILGLNTSLLMKRSIPGEIPVIVIVGIAGAFMGGFLGNMIVAASAFGPSITGMVLAVIGSMILLLLYRRAVQNAD